MATVFPFSRHITQQFALVDTAGNILVDSLGNVLVAFPSVGSIALYRLLYPHYIADQYLDELTVIGVPTDLWPPTWQVEPLNDVAIDAFRSHGPPISVSIYQPPTYLGFGYKPKIYWDKGVLVGA